MLAERRVIDISAPDDEGRYAMDWSMTFTAADDDVLLDRTPIPGEDKGGIWGGYAGLSLRWTADLTNCKIVGASPLPAVSAPASSSISTILRCPP